MKTLKSIAGYLWAILPLIVAPATFFGHTYFSRTLAETTGITIHPRYSGGEVVRVVKHGAYQTAIHRPVFDGLIGPTQEGFVQINWAPAKGLPPAVREGIDYNGDGREDFSIRLDTKTGETAVMKNNPAVLALEKSYHLRDGWAVRIKLERR